MFFVRRRIRNATILLFTLTALTCLWWLEGRALRPHAFTTGYLLFGSLLFLIAYGWRKKVPFLPLGNSSTLLQWHLYAGTGAIWIYLLHTSFRWPNGVLETWLASLYLATTFSGLYGLYLTRTIPRRLTSLPTEVIYERIPSLRQQTAAQAKELVRQAQGTPGGTVIANFYLQRLFPFLEQPRSWRYQFYPTSRWRRELLSEAQSLPRYLSETDKQKLDELIPLITTKDDLDYHAALQGWLKGWLFVHLGCTYSLLLVATLHAILAHAFQGGSR